MQTLDAKQTVNNTSIDMPDTSNSHVHNTNMPEQNINHDNRDIGQNVDPKELEKFTTIADQWWDKKGAFAPLHHINPLRLNWIAQNVQRGLGAELAGLKVLDVGCGGGILAESMARRGADVTGIDLGEENLKAASIHAQQSGLSDNLRYQYTPVEALAQTQAGQYDVVTCMEMLEHVPDPNSIVQSCFQLLKPDGVCVLSTINRNPKSFLFAIVGAEYVLKLLDKGTHDFHKFITPAELDKMAINTGFKRQDIIGLHYNPLTKNYWLAQNVDVNYMMAVKKQG